MKKIIVSLMLALLSAVALAAPFGTLLSSGASMGGEVPDKISENQVDGALFYRFSANKGDSVSIGILHDTNYSIGFWVFNGSDYGEGSDPSDFGDKFDVDDLGFLGQVDDEQDSFVDFAEDPISYLIAVTKSQGASSEDPAVKFTILATAQQNVPEPGSVALIGLALAGVAVMRRRKS